MSKHPPTVSKKYAGKWIAWDYGRTKIIASGTDAAHVRVQAQQTGEAKPILAKVPSGRRLVGTGK